MASPVSSQPAEQTARARAFWRSSAAPAGLVAEAVFVCQSDIAANQVVFPILITLLEVHYFAQTCADCNQGNSWRKSALGEWEPFWESGGVR